MRIRVMIYKSVIKTGLNAGKEVRPVRERAVCEHVCCDQGHIIVSIAVVMQQIDTVMRLVRERPYEIL